MYEMYAKKYSGNHFNVKCKVNRSGAIVSVHSCTHQLILMI